MTSHLNSHRTTNIKPEMLFGVQTGNGTPHDKYNILGIAHAWTKRKDNIFMQIRLVQNFTVIFEWGKGLVLWRSTHGTGHIPGIFSLHAGYSALRHFSPMNQWSGGEGAAFKPIKLFVHSPFKNSLSRWVNLRPFRFTLELSGLVRATEGQNKAVTTPSDQ